MQRWFQSRLSNTELSDDELGKQCCLDEFNKNNRIVQVLFVQNVLLAYTILSYSMKCFVCRIASDRHSYSTYCLCFDWMDLSMMRCVRHWFLFGIALFACDVFGCAASDPFAPYTVHRIGLRDCIAYHALSSFRAIHCCSIGPSHRRICGNKHRFLCLFLCLALPVRRSTICSH